MFDDPRLVEWALTYGLYCGLQNFRHTIRGLQPGSLSSDLPQRGRGSVALIRSLKPGFRLGYIDDVHVEYHVHDANSSGSATNRSVEEQLAVYRPMVRGFEELSVEFAWTSREKRALARKVGADHFWRIGYSLLWSCGRREEALESFRRGRRFWPWSLASWKTYLMARARYRWTGTEPAKM